MNDRNLKIATLIASLLLAGWALSSPWQRSDDTERVALVASLGGPCRARPLLLAGPRCGEFGRACSR